MSLLHSVSRGCRRLERSVVGGVSGWKEGLGCSVISSHFPQSLGGSVQPLRGCFDEGQRVVKGTGPSPPLELCHFRDLEPN